MSQPPPSPKGSPDAESLPPHPHPPGQHTHKRKFRLCSGFGGDRLKAKHPASAAFRQPASCRQYLSTLQIACQSGFGVIERSNLVLPVHYLNPVFYMALLSAWASLGKTARSCPGHPFPPTRASPHPLPCSVLQAEHSSGYRADVCTRSGSSHG